MVLLVVRPANAGDPVTPGRLRDVVLEHQRFYEQTFPDLSFVVLEGGRDWIDDINSLVGLLGREPSSLDYEHPPKLRALLTEVSLERIVLMLRHQVPSASLFRPDPAVQARKGVCVLTLSGCPIVSGGDTAARFLLDPSEEQGGGIPEELWLECEAYLAYAFDHEAYHCLSSFYEGPQPMSFEELWGEYWHFRQEHGADAYALARHLQRYGGRGAFADKLRLVRGSGLYEGDVDHWTCAALDHVFDLPEEQLANASASELFRTASQIRDDLVGDYPAYLAYRRAATETMARLGVDAQIVEGARSSVPQGSFDPALVGALVDESRRCRDELLASDSTGRPRLQLRGD